MKALCVALLALSAFMSSATFAADPDCSVMPDFINPEKGHHFDYHELETLPEIELLAKFPSPLPTNIFTAYFEQWWRDEYVCWATRVTYLKDTSTETTYAMYTTHDDYCDGGNTLGFILDLEAYTDNENDRKNVLVAEIGDSVVHCPDKEGVKRVNELLARERN